jgi:hypothetical protein
MKRLLSLCGWAALATLCGLFFFWSLSWDTSAFSQSLASTSVGGLFGAGLVWVARIGAVMFTINSVLRALYALLG